MAESSTAPASVTGSKSLQRAARGSVLNAAGAAVAAAMGLGLTVAVARSTSPREAGVFFLATSLFLLLTNIGQLGSGTGLVYFLSGARARHELKSAQAYMRIAARPVIVLAVAMSVAMFLGAEPLARLLSAEAEGEFARYMRAMAFFLPWAAALNLSMSATRGLGTMKPFALLDQVVRPTAQFLAVAAALMASGADHLALAWSLIYLPLGLLGWRWWQRLRDRSATDGEVRTEVSASRFWRFTAPRAFAAVAQMAMQRLDILLVGAIVGLAEAAVYTAATRFLVLGQSAARAVSMSVQPLLGEALARRDRSDALGLYQSTTAWLVLATWPIYFVLITNGSTILSVFGEGFDDGRSALLILSVAMLVGSGCGMVDMVLTMAGRSVWNLMNVILAFAVNLGVDLVLIPRIGITGAAIGWAAGILVANLVPLTQVGLSLKLHPFGRGTLTAMACAATSYGLVPLATRSLLPVTSFATLGLTLALSTAIYVGFILRWRGPLQIADLIDAVRRRRSTDR